MVVTPEQYDALQADLAAMTEPGPVSGEFGPKLYGGFEDEADTDGYFEPGSDAAVEEMPGGGLDGLER